MTYFENLVHLDETVLVVIELVDHVPDLRIDVLIGDLLDLSDGVNQLLRGDENLPRR